MQSFILRKISSLKAHASIFQIKIKYNYVI